MAGESVFESDGGGNVAGVDLIHIFAIVGVHADDAADALASPFAGFKTYEPDLSMPE